MITPTFYKTYYNVFKFTVSYVHYEINNLEIDKIPIFRLYNFLVIAAILLEYT